MISPHDIITRNQLYRILHERSEYLDRQLAQERAHRLEITEELLKALTRYRDVIIDLAERVATLEKQP